VDALEKVYGPNQRRSHLRPRVPRPALRGGTDERLRQLAITAERIGERYCLVAALRNCLLSKNEMAVSSGEGSADGWAA
jgi:hypothetical protein